MNLNIYNNKFNFSQNFYVKNISVPYQKQQSKYFSKPPRDKNLIKFILERRIQSQQEDFKIQQQETANTKKLQNSNGAGNFEQLVQQAQQPIQALDKQQRYSLQDKLMKQQETLFGVPRRWQIVAMMALAFVLCNMDKMNMSVAIIPMAQEFGWSATVRGIVNSSFFWGYTLTQIPAGFLATKFTGARVIFGGVLFWSLGTVIAPPLAHINFWALCFSRVMVGLGEGFAPSAVTFIMASIIPSRERARAVTSVFGSLEVGSVVGLLLCGFMIKSLGWASVFYFFGVAGILWCMVWPLFKPSDPSLNIEDTSTSDAKPSKIPYRMFLQNRAVLAVIVAHFCYNWGYYALLTWLPSYFEIGLHLNVEKSSLFTLVPNLAMMFMTPVVGPIADGLRARGWQTTNVRKLCQGLSFGIPAVGMVAVGLLSPFAINDQGYVLSSIIVVLSISFAMGSWARAGLYCNHQDISPRYAGALLGLSNAAGALPGVIAVPLVGFLFDKTQSWLFSLFLPTAICQVIGLCIYSIFASSKRIDFDELQQKYEASKLKQS